MSEHDDPVQRRATHLPLMLGGMLAVFLTVFLILITGGFFFYVVLAVGGLLAVGMLHWVTWGKLLTDQTAGEREEAELLDRARADEGGPSWTYRR
jgi:hypothetical protein